MHSVDLIYRPTDKIRIDTIFITSDVDQGLGGIEQSGDAFRFRLTASPRKGRWHDFGVFFFDEGTDISDMGYQMTDNWLFAGSQNGLKFSDYDDSSIFLSNAFELGVSYEANADLNKAGTSTFLTYKGSFKNTTNVEFTNFYRTASKDYWITRGDVTAPYIKKPENYGTMLQFMGPSRNFFNYVLQVNREKGTQWMSSALGFSTSYMVMGDFALRDNLSLRLDVSTQ